MRYCDLARVRGELGRPIDDEEQALDAIETASLEISGAHIAGDRVIPSEDSAAFRPVRHFAAIGAAGIITGSAHLERAFTAFLSYLRGDKAEEFEAPVLKPKPKSKAKKTK